MGTLFSKQYKYLRLPGPVTSALSLRTRSAFTGRLISAFVLLYCLAVLYLWRYQSYRDPTSPFFSTSRGYELGYSAIRQQEANKFIETVNNAPEYIGSDDQPEMCVGVVSIAREHVRYFRTTVGSLLEGLHPEERAKIYLILFTAHTDPSVHPAHSEPWFHNVADHILTYQLPPRRIKHLQRLEAEGKTCNLFVEKGLFDHTYLMKACLASGAPYMALIEDDVLAMDGWFHRTQAAIADVEKKTAAKGKSKDDFFYLRLFYTEQYLGWNDEEWPHYLFWSLIVFLTTNIALLVTRRAFSSTHNVLSPLNIIIICCVFVPLSIILFFASGRVTVFPQPNGVHEMNKFGCCFQGVVFSRSKALKLVDYYDKRVKGFKDTASEQYADKHGETRWAITPSVLQHVGTHSSKGDDFRESMKEDLAVSQTLWSFPFELFDAKLLKAEHDLIQPDAS